MSGLTDEEREALRDWWDSESEADTAGTMLANLDATVERIIADRERAAEARALREAAVATLSMQYPTSADPDVWGAWLQDRADRIEGGDA